MAFLLPRVDSLLHLMRDKVQLIHALAELQDERLERGTGQLLDPFNETPIAAAAKHSAKEARREYYFRLHGLLSSALPTWVVESERLDPRKEEALYGEVDDRVEKLKQAVAKLKPKPKPW